MSNAGKGICIHCGRLVYVQRQCPHCRFSNIQPCPHDNQHFVYQDSDGYYWSNSNGWVEKKTSASKFKVVTLLKCNFPISRGEVKLIPYKEAK